MLLMYIKKILYHFKQMLKGLPKHPFLAWEKFLSHLEMDSGLSLIWLSPTRLFVRYKEKQILDGISFNDLKKVGNYYIPNTFKIDTSSIIYSAGIGTNITFDRAIHDISKAHVYMIDPTPMAKKYVEDQKIGDAFRFHPIALSTKDGEITFYPDNHPHDLTKTTSFSMINRTGAKNFLTVPCKTLKSFMNEQGHDKIDILKMDIEGAARPVLEQAIKDEIYPTIIICEFEIPANPVKAVKELNQIIELINTLKSKSYDCRTITDAHFGARIEFMGVKQ
jgi:FkbM family methyltransferase